jgi:hypothetical protein
MSMLLPITPFIDNFRYGDRDISWVPDQTPCKDGGDNWSVCGEDDEGEFRCLDSTATCGNGVIDNSIGEECECVRTTFVAVRTSGDSVVLRMNSSRTSVCMQCNSAAPNVRGLPLRGNMYVH